ncbi:MAG: hypothetical protein AMXMBFR48_14750 [Ignavibacteriales bacterium]
MSKKISKLLKEKNALALEISKLKIKINQNNVMVGENVSKYDVAKLYNEMHELVGKLVGVKTRIAKLNVEIYDKIFMMSELKSLLVFLRDLDTKNGVYSSFNRRTQESVPEKYTATLDELFVDAETKKITSQMAALQDELDEFNQKAVTLE